jgi:hypothetical protein
LAEGRSKLILISVAVAESIWLFALFSMLGLLSDLGGSPLPWFSLLIFMLVATAAGYVLAGTEGEEVSIAIRQSIFGIIFIYLIIGTGTFIEDNSFDIGWIFRLVSGDLVNTASASVLFALFATIWMWRHGLKLGSDRHPEDRLNRIFKVGIAVLAVAMIVDQASDEDLGTATLIVPFFGATLVGMAVGRLPESGVGKNVGGWARTIGISVFGIMGVGLLIGVLGGAYGNGGVREWLINLFRRDDLSEEDQTIIVRSGQDIFGERAERAVETGSDNVDTLINILQYPLIVLAVVATFFILAMAFRRFGSRDSDGGDEERESIRDELETNGDMARLLGGLVPSWWRRKQSRMWRHPDDPGFAEMFKLYFDSLTMGVKWGMAFHPHMTPDERLPLLEAALPGAPVREVTNRFNAACYGKIPTDAQTVADLRTAMDAAEKAIRES